MLYNLKIKYKNKSLIYTLFFCIIIMISILFGGYLTIHGYSFHTKPHKSLSRYVNKFIHLDNKNNTDDYNSSFKLNSLYVYINKKNYTRIEELRKVALENNYLESSSKKFMSCILKHNDRFIKSKIRLKGDASDHWSEDKWSFRLKIDGNQNLFFGMKEFSVQRPETRENLREWLFKRLLRKEDLISLRYEFVNVYINDELKGIYAIEEIPSKLLIENNKRREGVVVKFNDNLLFE